MSIAGATRKPSSFSIQLSLSTHSWQSVRSSGDWRCRVSSKLHQVAGAAIFIDEAHAALPVHLWPQAWLWLHELERDWSCHIVLGSGSLQRFWEHEEFVTPKASVSQIVATDIRESSADHERRRLKYRSRAEPLDLKGLTTFIKSTDGPRLLIVNTVQSAAVIARHLANEFGGEHIEHLSTALTPRDRQATLDLVKLRLRQPNHRDWTLVATSCVEAGVDLSFRTGIRERCSLTSLLQTSGRVNRSNEYEQANVWDIQLRHDHMLRPHPAFETSSRVLGELFVEDKVSPDFCTDTLRREITQEGMPKKKKDILIAERNADFPRVEQLFRVIDSDTVTAIVDEALVRRLEEHEKITRTELQSASVICAPILFAPQQHISRNRPAQAPTRFRPLTSGRRLETAASHARNTSRQVSARSRAWSETLRVTFDALSHLVPSWLG